MVVSKTQLNTGIALIVMMSIIGLVFQTISITQAAPNFQINYQGKLTTAANVAVSDGTYNMRFWLLASSTAATSSALWTESLTGTNKVTVSNGLFSIMLGSTSALTSVNFNQTLYLGVEIGGTTTPGWDGEMSPRKVLGTVPAAFEADKLDGLTSSQFVRTDATSTIASSSPETLLTITQNGEGDIFNLFASTTKVFSVLSNGNVGVGTSSPVARFAVAGNSYFGGNVTATGTLTTVGLTVTGSSTLGFASTTALTVSGNAYLNAFTANSGTTTAASSTNFFSTTGTFTNLFGTNATLSAFLGTNATITNATTTNLAATSFKIGSDVITDITGTNLSVTNGVLSATASGGSNWVYDGSRLSPSTTVGTIGIGVFASSTIGGGAGATGLTINGGATTTGNAYFVSNIGIGSTTPSARLSITGTAGNTTALFRTASSTGSTTLAVLASGDVEVPNNLISKGITWSPYPAAEVGNWRAITYGNGLFVAVSTVGTNQIMTSADGVTWTLRLAPEANTWISIAYGNGLFVAVSTGGTNRIMTSPDGISWTLRSASEVNGWTSVTYGNGLFVAVSSDGTNRVMTSPDGVIWTARTAAEASGWQSVTYGNGRFVAVANIGTNRTMYSTNGINWTASAASVVDGWNSITYGNGLFVAVADSGSIMTSPDAITWTTRTAPEANLWYSVTYGNGLFVAVSNNGVNQIMTSPDGITWSPRVAPESNGWRGVTYGNGRFVAIATSGTNRVMTSGKVEINQLAHNNVYQGGMSVLGASFNIGTTTGTTSPFRNNIMNIASTSGTSLLTMTQNGFLGIGSTSPSRLLTVQGDAYFQNSITAASGTLTYASTTGLTALNFMTTNLVSTFASSTFASTTAFTVFGSFYDRTSSAGTNGMVLQTTGSGVQWVATSTLGLSGAQSDWNQLTTAGVLAPSTTVGIRVSASSTIGGGTGATGLTIFGNSTTTLNSYIAGTLGIGTTSPSATLALTGSGTTNLFAFASSTGSNLLSLTARGALMFGTTTSADIFLNGGATSTQTQTNQYNIAIGNQAFSYPSTTDSAFSNIAFGYRALYGSSSVPMTGDFNFAAGYEALKDNTTGSDNTAIGYQALQSNSSGLYNNAFGSSAMRFNVSGSHNNAFGFWTLRKNTTGSHNIGFGQQTLVENTTGLNNTALGRNALYTNTTGSNNIALGEYALLSNETGSYNIALGANAMEQITGSANVALGWKALNGATYPATAASSTAVGTWAGMTNQTGNNNLFLGDEADSISSALSNVIAIGSHAKVARSNSMVLGGTGIWNTDIVTGTSTPWAKLSIQNNYGSTTALFDIATTTSSAFATSSIFRVNHNGYVGIGTTNPGLSSTAGRGYLTIKGSTGRGVLQLTSAASDVDGTNLGGLEWNDSNSTSTDNRVGYISTLLQGTTANNRGSYMAFGTRPDGGSAAVERMRIHNNGTVAIGRTSSVVMLDVRGVETVDPFRVASSSNEVYFQILNGGNVGIGTTTPSQKLTVAGGMHLTGGLFDRTASAGTNGMVLQTNGSGVQWVATSTLGLGGGSGALSDWNQLTTAGVLAPSTTVGIRVSASSTIGGGTGATGLTINGGATTTGNAYFASSIGIGTQPSAYKLDVSGDGRFSGNVVVGTSGVASSAYLYVKRNSGVSSNMNLILDNEEFGVNISSIMSFQTGGGGRGNIRGGQDALGNTSLSFENSANTETMRITDTGRIGIGTTSPSATLALTGSGTTNLFAFASSTGSNLLSLTARGALMFGTTTSADIFLNGGATSTQTQTNGDNIAVGNQALSYYTPGSAIYNIALGKQALYGSSSVPMTGGNNFAAGYQALKDNTSGFDNGAIGQWALTSNTSGNRNNAFGYSALYSNTTGANNNAIGRSALEVNTTGSFNNAIGESALYVNTTGSQNIGIGQRSGYNNTTGSNNISLGAFAMYSNGSSGSVGIGHYAFYNANPATSTALGSFAGYDGSGSNNLYLGDEADTVRSGLTLQNASALGSHAKVGASNSMVLGGNGIWNTNIVTGTSTPWAKLSIQNNYGSTTALFDIATTTSAAYATSSIFRVGHDGKVSLGSTTPESLLLTLQKTGITGSQIAGIKEYFNFANTTENAIYYGDNAYIVNAPTATSTLVGKIIRIEDSTSLGNTVRGLEVQAQRGTNTKGENTGVSGFGRTFGLRGTTEGDAGDTFVPAGVFAQSRGTTQGNALRAYSGTITTSSLAQLFHDTSVFSGTGLLMNFGNSGGSFAATSSGKFIDLQVGGTSRFTVTSAGTTTIGDGTTARMAGLQIGYGGLCVDNDGACTASTTGRITSVSLGSGNSDLAEMYFSSDALEAGEIVAMAGGLSIERASEASANRVIGVVSTKPGLLLGFDDESLRTGEQGYPVGLKGRVPVKLSTENGPILKGDRITLSSIDGIGMKATESSVVVGIALEDFDGEHAYTTGFMNQFGDDLVKAKMKPLNQNMDARTQDGCSYGGGTEQGETPCVKDKVGKIKVATTEIDTLTEVIEELEEEVAKTATTRTGETVTVGQALMFIDLQYYTIASEQNILAELLATTSLGTNTSTEQGSTLLSGGETLWSRIKTLAQNFVNGVLNVAGIKTEELCVGSVCVDEATFLKMVEKAGGTSTSGAGNANSDTAPTDEQNDSRVSPQLEETGGEEPTSPTGEGSQEGNTDTTTPPRTENSIESGGDENNGEQNTSPPPAEPPQEIAPIEESEPTPEPLAIENPIPEAQPAP